MVTQEKFDGIKSFKCEECGMHYETKELAERCEEFCIEHSSCNSDITKKSLERA